MTAAGVEDNYIFRNYLYCQCLRIIVNLLKHKYSSVHSKKVIKHNGTRNV